MATTTNTIKAKTFTYRSWGLITMFAKFNPWNSRYEQLDPSIFGECELVLHRPNQPLHPKLRSFMKDFYKRRDGKPLTESELEYLPSWAMVHPKYGVVAWLNPNLSKYLNHKDHIFEYDREEESKTRLLELMEGGEWVQSREVEMRSAAKKGSID